MADFQTAGRGRQGRVWWSGAQPESSFLCSILLKGNTVPTIATMKIPALMFSLAAVQALREFILTRLTGKSLEFSKKVSHKICSCWPNDIFLRETNGKLLGKIGGVLVESQDVTRLNSTEKIFVVGVGINWQKSSDVSSFGIENLGKSTSKRVDRVDNKGISREREFKRSDFLANPDVPPAFIFGPSCISSPEEKQEYMPPRALLPHFIAKVNDIVSLVPKNARKLLQIINRQDALIGKMTTQNGRVCQVKEILSAGHLKLSECPVSQINASNTENTMKCNNVRIERDPNITGIIKSEIVKDNLIASGCSPSRVLFSDDSGDSSV